MSSSADYRAGFASGHRVGLVSGAVLTLGLVLALLAFTAGALTSCDPVEEAVPARGAR